MEGNLLVDIPDKLCAPVGTNETLFINEIRVLCRGYIPIRRMVKWKLVTQADKDNIIHRLLDNFIFDPTREAVIVYLNHKMPLALNEFRGKLHRHYKKIKAKDGIQVARASNHEQVESMDDWVFLCDMWETPKFKAIVDANVENRGKMKYNHKTGSRSHVRVMTDFQAEDEDHEEEFNEIDLFRVTHTNDKGDWINDEAEKEYNMMCDLMVAPDMEVDGEVQSRLTSVEIIEKVRGYRSGYIKGLGAGPAHCRDSSTVRPSRSRATEDPRVEMLMAENKELRSECNELKGECNELRGNYKDLQGKYDGLAQDVGNLKNYFLSFPDSSACD